MCFRHCTIVVVETSAQLSAQQHKLLMLGYLLLSQVLRFLFQFSVLSLQCLQNVERLSNLFDANAMSSKFRLELYCAAQWCKWRPRAPYRRLTEMNLLAFDRICRLDVFFASFISGSCFFNVSKHSFKWARRFFSSLLCTSRVPAL